MRYAAFCIALLLLCAEGCVHTAPPQTPDVDTPKTYELFLHDHDQLCLPDPHAPELRSCMTVGQFRVFLHSALAN